MINVAFDTESSLTNVVFDPERRDTERRDTERDTERRDTERAVIMTA